MQYALETNTEIDRRVALGISKRSTDKRYHNAIAKALSEYRLLSHGRNRVGFDTGDGYVLKLPLHNMGELDNRAEANLYNARPHSIYAQCLLMDYCGVDACLMEKVFPYGNIELPVWAGAVDCCQVGLTKDGRLVAYDFGPY